MLEGDSASATNGTETPGGSGAGAPGGTVAASTHGGASEGQQSVPDIDALRAELRKKNSEAENLRKRLREAEEVGLSEKEKLEKRVRELEMEREALAKERDLALIRSEVARVAATAGVIIPSEAYKLVDETFIKVEGGVVTGVEEAIKDLRRRLPQLFRPGSADGSGGNRSGVSAADDMNARIRRAMGRG